MIDTTPGINQEGSKQQTHPKPARDNHEGSKERKQGNKERSKEETQGLNQERSITQCRDSRVCVAEGRTHTTPRQAEHTTVPVPEVVNFPHSIN